MKKLIVLVLLAIAPSVWGDATGTNCEKGADADFEVLDQPMMAILNSFNPPSGYTCHFDSLFCRGNGNGKEFEVYLYSRVFDYPSYDCTQKHGPCLDTILNPGEQDLYIPLDVEADTMVVAYVVMWNCIDDPQIETDVDDVPAGVTYVETGDGDCSAESFYNNIEGNLAERIQYCLYYTLTPVPSDAGRRRQMLTGEEGEEPEPIHMVYCSADDSHSEL